MNPTTSRASRPRHTIPVYEVRLVQSRRPLRLADETVPESGSAARVAHALIGRTNREHLACLFLNGQHRIVGAHIAAVGGQHIIGTIDVRVVLRAALAACATAIVLGHSVAGNRMSVLLPARKCGVVRRWARRSRVARDLGGT